MGYCLSTDVGVERKLESERHDAEFVDLPDFRPDVSPSGCSATMCRFTVFLVDGSSKDASRSRRVGHGNRSNVSVVGNSEHVARINRDSVHSVQLVLQHVR